MDVLTLYEVARQVQEQLDARVAYVHPVRKDRLGSERELDIVIPSTKFALSFVREAVRDAGYRMHVFGPAVSEEDLQDCMLQSLLAAATIYLRKYPEIQSWRLYLRQVLIARIHALSRRKQAMKNGSRFCTDEEAYELSLETLLGDVVDGDRQMPEQLIAPVDMYKEFDDTNFKAAFYATLLPRQQRIVDYLYARAHGYTEYTDTKIAGMLGIHRKQLERDVMYIQSAYTHYAALD